MNLMIRKKDMALVAAVTVALLVAATALSLVPGRAGMILLPALCVAAVLIVLLERYRRLVADLDAGRLEQEGRRELDYRQVESLFSLFSALKPDLPLPDMRDWAISPDLLKKMVEVILTERVRFVVEASSGVSTVVIAYCLRKLGEGGRVVSLEHDARYAAISRALVSSHGLEDVATVIHAPLKEFRLDGRDWFWYDMDGLKIERPVDLLVVDGPPGTIRRMCRYPAVPLLHRHLSDRSTIILHDGGRPDESEIAALWVKEHGDLTSEFLDVEKGAFLLRRNSPTEAGREPRKQPPAQERM